MKKTLLAALAALISLQAAPALAENYDMNLTRKDRNVYTIDGKDIVIQTRYCYVHLPDLCAFLASEGCVSRMATTAWSKPFAPCCGYETEMMSRDRC